MPRRGARTRIARDVYEDRTGRSIIYQQHGRQREIRFPPQATIAEMREEVARRLAKDAGSGQAKTFRGSLAAAVDRWEPLEQTLSSWQERRAELRAWCRAVVDGKPLGDRRLRAITEMIARTVLSQWTQAGVAPKTIRNRRWSLQHLYHLTLGPKAPTPVDDISPPPKTKTIPRMVDPEHVLTVYANLLKAETTGLLRDAKTRARFMVRASTGKRPSEIMRAQPEDVDIARREWRVRDGKGGWSEGLYLNDDMVLAWLVFIGAKAWGPFNTGSMARVLRAAGWKAGVRPYELRHSVGIALSDAGVDLSDIAPFLGHIDLRTTRSTYVPIRAARMQRASEALEGRFKGWPSEG
jgi:integrase